jgi:hypothetical protein
MFYTSTCPSARHSLFFIRNGSTESVCAFEFDAGIKPWCVGCHEDAQLLVVGTNQGLYFIPCLLFLPFSSFVLTHAILDANAQL